MNHGKEKEPCNSTALIKFDCYKVTNYCASVFTFDKEARA